MVHSALSVGGCWIVYRMRALRSQSVKDLGRSAYIILYPYLFCSVPPSLLSFFFSLLYFLTKTKMAEAV